MRFSLSYYIMYSNADIDSLSVGQLRKLLKGGAVRVRCGSGMKVGLSAPQHKKLMSAHKKGKMMTLTLDPYQAQMHGQGLFGDIGNFFSRTVPSTLIHQGLPEAGAAIGSAGGSYLGGPVGSLVGSELGRRGGKKLAEETGRRTGYGVKKGRGTRLEDQKFSLAEAADAGRRLFGRGQPIEDQKFSLAEAADAGRRLFGGKVHMKGKGAMTDMLKKAAKEAAMKMAKKAGSHALHKVLPMASERLGSMAGEYAGVAGGGDAGRMLGRMLEDEIAARTGLGMKRARGRPKKLMKGSALFVAGAR